MVYIFLTYCFIKTFIMIKHVVCWKIKDFAEGRINLKYFTHEKLLLSLKEKLSMN